MTIFPDSHYAHCPRCGQCEGMGLVTQNGLGYVQCYCGARGPGVERANFVHSGAFDLNAYDEAIRRAWNFRSGSDGRDEVVAQIVSVDSYIKMHVDRGSEPPAILLKERANWEGLLATLETPNPTKQAI